MESMENAGACLSITREELHQILATFQANIIDAVRTMVHGDPPMCSRCKDPAKSQDVPPSVQISRHASAEAIYWAPIDAHRPRNQHKLSLKPRAAPKVFTNLYLNEVEPRSMDMMIREVQAIDIHKISDAERDEKVALNTILASKFPLPEECSDAFPSDGTSESSIASVTSTPRAAHTVCIPTSSPASSVATQPETTQLSSHGYQPMTMMLQEPTISGKAHADGPATSCCSNSVAKPRNPADPLIVETTIPRATPKPTMQVTTAAAIGLDLSAASHGVPNLNLHFKQSASPVATTLSFSQQPPGTTHVTTHGLDADMVNPYAPILTVTEMAQSQDDHASMDMEDVIPTTLDINSSSTNSSGQQVAVTSGYALPSTTMLGSSPSVPPTSYETQLISSFDMGDAEGLQNAAVDVPGMSSAGEPVRMQRLPAGNVTSTSPNPALSQHATLEPTRHDTGATGETVSAAAPAKENLDPKVLAIDNLVKRKRDAQSFVEISSAGTQTTEKADEEPDSFLMLGPAFHEVLRNELVDLVGEFDNLTALQPWFATFRLSMKSIHNWQTLLAQEIERQHFQGFTHGADEDFQQSYTKLTSVYKVCKTIPLAWHFQYWLHDFTLPLIIQDVLSKLQPHPLEGTVTTQRHEGLRRIFTAVAGAYLRLILFKAQDSSSEIELSKYSSKHLPDGNSTGWRVLEQITIATEYTKASRAARSGDKTYEQLIIIAEKAFSEQYESVWRTVVRTKEVSAEKTRGSRNGYASKDAYVQEMHNKKKFIQDDGILQLLFEIRRMPFNEDLNKIVPTPLQRNILGPSERKPVIREFTVQLLLAHDEWCAIHPNSEVMKFKDTYQALKLLAIKKEAQIAERVESLSHATRADCSRSYINHAKILRKKCIDEPLETLKSLVGEFEGECERMIDMGRYDAKFRDEIPVLEMSLARQSIEEDLEPKAQRMCYISKEGRSALGDAGWKLAGGELGPMADQED